MQLRFLSYFVFTDLVGVSIKNEENYTLRLYTRTRNDVGCGCGSLTDYIAI